MEPPLVPVRSAAQVERRRSKMSPARFEPTLTRQSRKLSWVLFAGAAILTIRNATASTDRASDVPKIRTYNLGSGTYNLGGESGQIMGASGGGGGAISADAFTRSSQSADIKLNLSSTSTAALCAGGGGGGALLPRVVNDQDIADGLRLNCYMADTAYVDHGLVHADGAGWAEYILAEKTLPFNATWPLVCSVSMQNLPPGPGSYLSFTAYVVSPDESYGMTQQFSVRKDDTPNIVVPLGVMVSQLGRWSVYVASGQRLLDQLSFDVKFQ